MATSGSTDFNNTASVIVTDAFILLTKAPIGGTLDSKDLALGLRVLNRMMKTWQVDGVKLWLEAEGTLSLTADQGTYTMGTGGDFTTARPLEIYTARFIESSTEEIPMQQISHTEYFNLPDKTTSGTPTTFYYNPRGGATATGQFLTWPVVSEASKSIKFTYRRPIEDFDASADDPDLPQEWLETINYNLAVRLAPYVGAIQRISEGDPSISDIAREKYELLKGWGREDTSLFIGVDNRDYG